MEALTSSSSGSTLSSTLTLSTTTSPSTAATGLVVSSSSLPSVTTSASAAAAAPVSLPAATVASTATLASAVGYDASNTIGTKKGFGSFVPSAIGSGSTSASGSSATSDAAATKHEASPRHGGKAVHSRDTKSFDYIAKTMFAGGIAGITAKTVIAPLDRVKILFQASNPQFERYAGTWTGVFKAARDIHRTSGVRGLWQGNAATALRIFPYAAIKFMAFEQYRNILMPTRRDETPYKKLVAGSLAGVTSVFFTYPMDLIRVRLAYETRVIPYMALVRKIYNEPAAGSKRPAHLRWIPQNGVANFYRGFLTSVLGMIPYAGVSFFTHDLMQEFCRNHIPWTLKPNQKKGLPDKNGDYSRPELRTVAELTCGGIAGAVSQTASYPLEVVRRKMQVAGALDPKNFVGMWDTIRHLYIAKGVRGFFVGLSIGYLKVTPMVAVSFTVYERMKGLLDIQ